MNPLKFLLILRARYKAALITMVLTLIGAFAAGELLPKRYTAETAVLVDVRASDPVSAVLIPATMAQGTMGTQVDIIKSDRVARKVVKMLRFDEDPAVKQMWQSATQGKGKLEDWMSSLLLKGLKVVPSRDSNLIAIAYTGSDPAFVAAVANAFAQGYIEASVELKVEPARQYSQWFSDQAKVLRENVERAQAKLSDFQRDKSIVATDEALDYEHTKLRELASRLTGVQAEVRDAQSKQRTETPDALPEVLQNAGVQNLRSSINQLEVKLKEAENNLGRNHPQYQRMISELAELKNRLAVETKHVASGYSSASGVGKTRESELRAAIDAQTRKILNMKRERDEIAVLLRDVETAKRAYEAVTNRFTQTSLESQATRTNVSVLTPAVEPIEASFPPQPMKLILIALAAGLLLGGAAVAGLEYLDQRIRTAEDLAEMLQLPVLSVIERDRPPRRLPFRVAFKALPLK